MLLGRVSLQAVAIASLDVFSIRIPGGLIEHGREIAGDLAEVCGIILETLLTVKRINHALILVDDIDLLETYQSPTRNARQQRSILGQALDQLHGTVGVDVVMTARSWYVHSRKDLQTLVDLGMSAPMQPADLVDIHQRRVKVKGRGGGAFLTEEALFEAAGDAEGLPGVFLQHLDTAFYQYLNEDEPGLRGYDWYLGGSSDNASNTSGSVAVRRWESSGERFATAIWRSTWPTRTCSLARS